MLPGPFDQLRDIHGPDAVGWWPPAPGWWLVALGALLAAWLLLAAARFVWRYPFFTWHHDAWRRLVGLRRALATDSPAEVATGLSELLRRVAMARLGRDSCAGLAGDDWLAWLAANDPEGFDWRRHGRPLIDLPYAPPGETADAAQLRRLIDAAIPWTRRVARRRWRRQAAANSV
jgi:hypothetical protein